jgi:hypothetical protein
MGPASATAANYKDPSDARILSTIKSHFSELMEAANRHDVKALHLMFLAIPFSTSGRQERRSVRR